MCLVATVASAAFGLTFDIDDPAASYAASFSPTTETTGSLSIYLSKSTIPEVFSSGGSHQFSSASIAFPDSSLFAGPATCDFVFSNEVNGTAWPLSSENFLSSPVATLASIPTVPVAAADMSSLAITCHGLPIPAAPVSEAEFAVSLSTSTGFTMDITPDGASLSFDPESAAIAPSIFTFSFARTPFVPLDDAALADCVSTIRGASPAALLDVAVTATASTYDIALGTTAQSPHLVSLLAGLTGSASIEALLPTIADIVDAAAGAGAPAGSLTLVDDNVYYGPAGSFLCEDAASSTGYAACAVPGNCGTAFQGALTCAVPSSTVSGGLDAVPGACTFATAPVPNATEGCDPKVSAVTLAIAGDTLTVTYTPVDRSKFHPSAHYAILLTDTQGVLNLDGAACAATGVSCTGLAGDLRVGLTGAAVRAGGAVAVEGVSVVAWAKTAVFEVDAIVVVGSDESSIFTSADRTTTVANVGITQVNLDGTAVFLPDADSAGNDQLLFSFSAPESRPSLTLAPEAVDSFIAVLPEGWSVSACAAVAADAATGVWPPYVRNADYHPAAADAAGHFAVPVDVDAPESQRAYVHCAVDAYSDSALTGISVGFGTNSTFYAATYITSIVPMSNEGDMFLGFSLTVAPSAPAIDAAALAAAAEVDAAAVAPTASPTVVTVLLRFDGSNQIFLSAALSVDAVQALITAASGKDGLEGFAGTVDEDSFSMGLTGEWQCGTAQSFGACVVANDCGDTFSQPFICVSAGAAMVSDESCLFDPKPVPEPISSGCGALLCKNPGGAFVSCTDASVCLPGCRTAPVPITAQDATNPALARHCVLNGTVVSAPAFCPSGLVSADPYAATCVPKSACVLLCTDHATGATVSCESEASWGTCSRLCGNGTRTRAPVCAQETAEGDVPVALGADMCVFSAPVAPLQQACTGTECEKHVWMCASSESAEAIPCSDEASWGACSVPCGLGQRTRTVSCAFIDGDGEVIDDDADGALCQAQSGPKPISAEGCGRTECPEAEWACIEEGATAPAPCANDTEWFTCPESGCSELKPTRDVSCYVEGFVVDGGNCTAPEPVGSHECDLVTDKCTISYDDAKCIFNSNGTVNPLANGYCLHSTATSPLHRRGACVDTHGAEVDPDWCGGAPALLEECPLAPCDGVKFEWTVRQGQCLNREYACQTYRINTVTCASIAGPLRLPVQPSFCDGQEKPATVERCARAACANGGTCKASVVVIDGVEHPNIFSGVCSCPLAVGGPLCSVAVAVSGASVAVHDDDYVFSWSVNDATVSTPMTISLISSKSPIPIIIGSVDTSDRSFAVPVADMNALVRPGNYSVTLHYGTHDITLRLTHVPLCSLSGHDCGAHGSCTAATGVCVCQGDWSGPRCSVSPCGTKGCNPEGSVCEDDTGAAVCNCATDGDGLPLLRDDRCYTPVTSCEDTLLCLNGGVRSVAVHGNTTECGACHCLGNYGGNNCGACNLDGKCGHGSPSTSCGQCVCNAGYHGSTCNQRHAIARVAFNPALLPWYSTAATGSLVLTAWVTGLEKALSSIVRSSGVAVTVLSHAKRTSSSTLLPSYVETTFAVPMASGSDAAFRSLADSNASTQYRALNQIKDALASGRLESEPAFVGLVTGAGLGLSDPNCSGSECPKNIGDGGVIVDDGNPEENSGKGSSSTTIIVVVVVVVVVVLLLVILIILAKKKRVLCFKPSHKDYAGNGGIQLGNTNYSV